MRSIIKTNSDTGTFVESEFNALEIRTLHAEPQVLYGKGAGSLPTASAVVSDLVSLLRES
jgi:homoserine dehydrogenase